MKYRFAVAAIAISGASAQLVPYPGPESSSTPPTPPPYTTPASSPPVSSVSSSTPASYVTVTYSDCPSQSIETLITVTNGVTVTYCPECHHTPGPSHTTVYTTVYQSLCSTGLVPATYTVTEECAEETPTWAATKEHHVPPGFTVTVKECHVCDKTPVPVTITEPCHDGCGKPTPPPAPTGEASQPPSGGSGSNMPAGPSGSGSSPPAGGNGGANRPPATPEDEHCPGPQCSHPAGGSPAGGSAPGGTPPYPTAGGDDSCPGGAHCPHGTGAPSPGNSSTPQSYTGGAVGSSFGLVSSIFMAVAVAALAFAL